MESDFINAKNDLFRVQALNEMEDVLTAEILKWDEFLVQNSTSNKDEDEKMILAVQKEKKGLQSVVNMIDSERKPMLKIVLCNSVSGPRTPDLQASLRHK